MPVAYNSLIFGLHPNKGRRSEQGSQSPPRLMRPGPTLLRKWQGCHFLHQTCLKPHLW